jgi:hypothetical protein
MGREFKGRFFGDKFSVVSFQFSVGGRNLSAIRRRRGRIEKKQTQDPGTDSVPGAPCRREEVYKWKSKRV